MNDEAFVHSVEASNTKSSILFALTNVIPGSKGAVEPPKLYGPHAPIIVPKTSNGYACVPDNLKSLSGVLGKPESSMIFQAGSHYRDIAVLQ
jgi:hypothetical protein